MKPGILNSIAGSVVFVKIVNASCKAHESKACVILSIQPIASIVKYNNVYQHLADYLRSLPSVRPRGFTSRDEPFIRVAVCHRAATGRKSAGRFRFGFRALSISLSGMVGRVAVRHRSLAVFHDFERVFVCGGYNGQGCRHQRLELGEYSSDSGDTNPLVDNCGVAGNGAFVFSALERGCALASIERLFRICVARVGLSAVSPDIFQL